jgi:hypothetical protein
MLTNTVNCALYTRNAITFNPPCHVVHEAAVKLSNMFADIVDQFKATQVQTAKKSFSKASAKPNSSVAALLEKRHHEEKLKSLKKTAGNLLVVPGTLLNHWEVSSRQAVQFHLDSTLNFVILIDVRSN